MKVKFLGAVGNVTGSRFLLENSHSKILIDSGLYQERDLRIRDWEKLPVDVSSVDSVLLTHAHLDHCGYLPKLVKDGFSGKIFCTPPTAEIAKIALLDAAKLQEEDAQRKKKRHEREGRKGPYPEVPLYTSEDAEKVFPLFEMIEYNKKTRVSSDIEVTYHDAGHVLGSAMIEATFNQNRIQRAAIFSGDIGRCNKPILRDPTFFQHANYVFMESTYGNKLHEEKEPATEKLRRIIIETQKKGGNVVIPTFAIERAQELLFYLSAFLRENKIPPITVFVDSPMAINVTEVFKNYPEYFDDETQKLIRQGKSPFDFPLLKTTRTNSESKAINYIKEPCIIMAGSGMCVGGRIKHHLVQNITRPESTILFVGYQAKGTLGREILERPEEVRILGSTYPVKARIEKINGFSAHADRDELLKWVGSFKEKPEKIFLVHGEEEVANDFAAVLKNKIHSSAKNNTAADTQIIVPEYLQEYEL
ncbi:MAG: MBL fold metallo-hydrolase [Candidatus Ratteibacteria bacterium]|nr:MBL fold metallo-hydrolase [Candidatus Ratteibacteria bacterium]